MSSPVRPLATRQEHRGELSHWEATTRIVGLLYFLLNPIMAVISLVTGVLLVRQRKISRHIYVPASAVAFSAALLTGQLPRYMRPWVEVAHTAAATTRRGHHAPAQVADAIGAQVSRDLPHWLLLQLPMAVAGGLFVGALWAGWRSKRVAVWRDDDPKTVAVPLKELDKAMKRTALWPDAPAPVAGTAIPSVQALKVRIGNERTDKPKPYDLTVRELGYQAYLDGPSGFGKTTTLLEIVAGLVEAPAAQQFRNPLVFVNMKPDPEITAALESIATAGGRSFHHITTSSGSYDPFAGKSWSEIASQVIEAEANSQDGGFSEPHHRRAAERFLRFASRALVQLSEAEPKRYQRDYTTLARLLQVDTMNAAAPKFDKDLANEWAQYVQELTTNKRLIESVDGLRQRVAGAAEGGARDVLRAAAHPLRLEEVIEAGDLVLFDLDAAADATSARLIGNLALQDLMSSMARLGRRSWQYATQGGRLIRDKNGDPIQVRHLELIVDEFGALGGTILAGAFQRLRTHGGGVLLSTQEKGSLDLAGPTFAETVLTNANVLMLHHQGPNASDYAEQIGTKTQLIETKQVFEEGSVLASNVYASGQGNIREGKGFRIHPDELRDLTPGQLIVRVNSRVSSDGSSYALARVQVRRLAQKRHRVAAGEVTDPSAVGPNPGPTASKKRRRLAKRGKPVSVPTEPVHEAPVAPSSVRRPLPAPKMENVQVTRPRIVRTEGTSLRKAPPPNEKPATRHSPTGAAPVVPVSDTTPKPVPVTTPSVEVDEVLPWDDYDD